MYLSLYIYIYIERERHIQIYIYICIYIYTHICIHNVCVCYIYIYICIYRRALSCQGWEHHTPAKAQGIEAGFEGRLQVSRRDETSTNEETCMYIYIYICIEREVYVYIYIYVKPEQDVRKRAPYVGQDRMQ